MDYVCIKKLSVGGKTYAPGETIPGAVFLGGRVNKLIAYGYISETEGSKPVSKPAEKPVEKPVAAEGESEKAEASQPTTAKPKKAASGDKK